uniref:Zinc finger protein 654 n=1 Tax=Oreochromis niloticus TaxID=8128 RepID=A0A669F219_ORENI
MKNIQLLVVMHKIHLILSHFCFIPGQLVEEYTGQWQVPLPQLKVLRTALYNFTKATTAFPDDCQHIQYVLSSLALSFFELMLFFSKEEFVEEPLKDILDSFQICHTRLMRHRNIYLQHVKQIIKVGGPWENPVLQGILKEDDLPPNEVEDYLSSELPVFLELRVRYLQACERMQEAMALAKSCLENREAGKHLYFHQAYLTCLCKASLHENLYKEMADIDGRDAVEIICNTESVEKDELLLSLCKAFLTQQLHNGDMYYIWDLVFIWSRLYLRAHPSRQGFLAECLQLASSATNVRAIFPFIKLVTTELGGDGIQVCVELCARALQLCDMQADTVTRSLVCKTIAFLLPHDLEICRACALLVFCQERSLEAYRTVSLLYMHPDQEPGGDAIYVKLYLTWGIFRYYNFVICLQLTWKDRALRTQQYSHLSHYCTFCGKDYKGLNVMRHALSHLKSRKLRCILCGKRFKQLPFAKKHILEHIDTMCKQKSSNKEPSIENAQAANGVIDNAGNKCKPWDKKQTSISEDETLGQRTGSKAKVSHLKREERIIRNLRTLIKKTSVLHKKCKKPNTNIFKQIDFKDEQVIIKEGLVIVSNPTVIEEEGQETPAGENACGADITYHLCPSASCDRVFLRMTNTLTKHAIKCHITEDKVLEKTFVWAKHKCTLCLRQIQFLQHYKDHMKSHSGPLPHFCYHLECKQRFVTQQELKDHINTHQPFRPQCPFTGCEKLFSSYQGLYDHEWRHYVPVPQKDELELGPSKLIKESAEAPWKQRVKVEEIWLQTDNYLEKPVADQHTDDTKPTINGYEDVKRNVSEGAMPTSHTNAASTTPTKRCRKRPTVEVDPLNVRDLEDISTLAEGVQQNIAEPHIPEHKTFKPEDPSYATFVKAPFIRPPPSTYLDESVLSMRKRRSIDDQVEDVAPEHKIRHRCDKCLSSYNSLEELQKHKALNTCSSLFGFDSDDESKFASLRFLTVFFFFFIALNNQ